MTEDELFKAIDDYFGDTRRSAKETLNALTDARDDIEMKIAAIEADMARDM